MACNTPKSIPQSIPSPNNNCDCINPLDYLFNIVEQLYISGRNNNLSNILSTILDEGYVTTICNICCPGCSGAWTLSSVETFLKFAEAVGLTQTAAVPPALPLQSNFLEEGVDFKDFECCLSIKASIETYLKYAEAVGLTTSAAVEALSPAGAVEKISTASGLENCCNNFEECFEGLTCWVTNRVRPSLKQQLIDTILDKGIIEYGELTSCPSSSKSSLCKLVDIFLEFDKKYSNWYGQDGPIGVIDKIVDKGITISCDETGRIVFASTETWLKYAEAMGYTQSASVPPAISNTTTVA